MSTSGIAPETAASNKKTELACPECGCTTVYRSQRRNWQERIACFLQRALPYRCRKCDARFFGRKS
jgi:predicted RNA-binding Zn-ribbon protein involved in translation (DUF1610 family)